MTYRVLCLDGGGSKGVYTLGVLQELEALLGGRPLCERFDAVYGTSTGSIIAAAIAVGFSIERVRKMYFDHIPGIMRQWQECLADLDIARAIDPDGDDTAAVKATRARAIKGIVGKPPKPPTSDKP